MRITRLAAVVAVAVLVAWTAAAYADYHSSSSMSPGADKAQAQLTTAITHARNSAASDAMSAATSHLGHVLNCIEGTRGKNFNGSWGHVCQGQGDGILVDIKGAKNAGSVMVVLEAADGLAVAGVKGKDLAAVQYAARGVAALLQVVADGIK